MDDITDRIRSLIVQNIDITVPVEELSNEDDLFQLGMDSISSIKLIIAIESEFGFEFDDDDLNMDNMKTIGKIAGYVEARVGHV